MSARSSSSRYTAASSAGASPTSRFSASAGTKPASSCSRRAAEYFAAQPPQEARSVSLTLAASRSKALSQSARELYPKTSAAKTAFPQEGDGGLLAAVAVRGEEELECLTHVRQTRGNPWFPREPPLYEGGPPGQVVMFGWHRPVRAGGDVGGCERGSSLYRLLTGGSG